MGLRQLPIYFRSMSFPRHAGQAAPGRGAAVPPCSPLQIHHAECEVNFLRLEKLLPGFAAGQARHIGTRLPHGGMDVLHLHVVQRCPYTAEVLLRQQQPVWGARGAEFTVRAYLDARMAEVVGCARVRRLLARYDYPNRHGLARDEKWQINRLLGEWLAHCLAEGHALHPAALAADG
jgi:uncharacterized protein YqiB (DUF1249 family)